MVKSDLDLTVYENTPLNTSSTQRTLNFRSYELSNHLGNVMAVVSDRKIAVDGNSDGIIDYLSTDVLSGTDYYVFGSNMPGRSFTSASYRYGFNGKELDPETGTQDYGMRIYNPGLGKFLSVDPLTKEYPWNSTYAFAENDVIRCIDLDGAEKFYTADGKLLGDLGDDPHIRMVDAKSIQTVSFWIDAANNPPLGADAKYIDRATANAVKYSSLIFKAGFSFNTLVSKDNETKTTQGAAGFEVKGNLDGKLGTLDINSDARLTGFGAEVSNESGTGKSKSAFVGSAKVYALEGAATMQMGNKNVQFKLASEGSIFSADASSDIGLLTGEGGKQGFFIGANTGAYTFKGEVNPSVYVFGYRFGFTIGGSLNSAHIGAGLGGYTDTNKGTRTLEGQFNIGLDAGIKVGFNVEQNW